MVFPDKKDIEESIASLETHIDTCSAVNMAMQAKRVGGIIDLSQSLRKISMNEAIDCHEKSDQKLRTFDDKCSCTFK